MDPDLGSNYAEEEAMLMLNVALLCANAAPTLRPTMSTVVSLLEGRSSVQNLLSDLSSEGAASASAVNRREVLAVFESDPQHVNGRTLRGLRSLH